MRSAALSIRLAEIGAGLLKDVLALSDWIRLKQNDAEASYAPVLKKEDGRVNWTRPARVIYNRLRGFTPWPGAFTSFGGQQLSIINARPHLEGAIEPGQLQRDGKRLFVGCGENSRLELLEVQLAGKKRMTAEAFLNGYKIAGSERLGAAH